jgi:HEPN domain-containing protein
MFDKEEYERWIKQADYTLKSAKRDKDAKDFWFVLKLIKLQNLQ